MTLAKIMKVYSVYQQWRYFWDHVPSRGWATGEVIAVQPVGFSKENRDRCGELKILGTENKGWFSGGWGAQQRVWAPCRF